jgi:hypothetical protein
MTRYLPMRAVNGIFARRNQNAFGIAALRRQASSVGGVIAQQRIMNKDVSKISQISVT